MKPLVWKAQHSSIPKFSSMGRVSWGDGGETWTRKSGGWSPPTQLPSHLPLLQCYPGVLPHPTVQYITTSKLQINFRVGVVRLLLMSRYSIKVAHTQLILEMYNSTSRGRTCGHGYKKQIVWHLCWSGLLWTRFWFWYKRARMIDQFLVVSFV